MGTTSWRSTRTGSVERFELAWCGAGLPALDGSPEVALDELETGLGRDVAAQGEHGVVRPVVATEERVHVRQARGVEVLHRADRRVVVGVALREDRGVDVDEGVAVGLVVVALALLLLDDVALVVEVLLRHGVEEVTVPVGLEPERELDRARGHVSK